jgi:hypothetical protein
MIRNLSDLTIWDLPVIKESLKDIQEQAPGITQDDAEKVLMVVVGMKMAYPEIKDSLLDERTMNRLVELSKSGETWPDEYLRLMLRKSLRPAYDSALRAGTDPVRSLTAQLVVLHPEKDFSAGEIEALVKVFQTEDAEKK